MIERKWEFIENRLELLKAPTKVVNAAHMIDQYMNNHPDLNYNTERWIKEYDRLSFKYNNITIEKSKYKFLFDLIYITQYCTACDECNVNCNECKLSCPDVRSCTPKCKHAENYLEIVTRWIYNMRKK